MRILSILTLMFFWSVGIALCQSVAESDVHSSSPASLHRVTSELNGDLQGDFVKYLSVNWLPDRERPFLLDDDLRGQPFDLKFTVVLLRDPGHEEWEATIVQAKNIRTEPDLRISHSKLVFDTGNYNDKQTVTVSHTGNPVIKVRDIWFAVSLWNKGGRKLDLVYKTIKVNDEGKPQISLSAAPNPVDEGQKVTITATISEPQIDRDALVPIGAGIILNTRYDFGADKECSQSFSPTPEIQIKRGEETGTYSFWVCDDNESEPMERIFFNISRYGLPMWLAFGNPAGVEVTINASDNEPDIIVEKNDLTVMEGQTDTLRVKLSQKPKPSEQVKIEITGYESTDLDTTASRPWEFAFDASDWNTWKKVAIGAKHDDDFEDEGPIELTLTASEGSTHSTTVNVKIEDDDTPAIVVTGSSSVTVVEGQRATFSVRLNGPPPGEVEVEISGYAGTLLDTLDLGSRNVLTFDASDWHDPQDVLIGAKHDADFLDELPVPLSLTGSGNFADPQTVEVTILDDDTPGVTLDRRELEVAEGRTVTFEVGLAGQPGRNVEVVITGYKDTVLDTTASDPRTHTFTASDWAAQTFTLGAVQDDNFVNEAEVLTLTAAGGFTRQMDVTILDDDTPGIVVLDLQPVLVVEGRTADFRVGLEGQPARDVEIRITGYKDTDLDTLASRPREFTFTPSDWAKTVTLGATQDDDVVDDPERLWFTAPDGSMDRQPVEVLIVDDDEPAILVDPQSLRIREGGSERFTAKLSAPPSGPVTVRITGYTGTDLDTLVSDPRELVFSTMDWNRSQMVTLGAKQDADYVNDYVPLTLTATGGGYGGGGVTQTVSVTIEEDDTAPPSAIRVTLSANPGEVEEGASTQITATLSETYSEALEIALKDLPGTAGREDYATPLPALSIAAGALRGSADVWTIEDDVFEGDEMFTIAINAEALPAGVVPASSSPVGITIIDHDTSPVKVTLSAAPEEVTEGEAVTVTVRLARALEDAVTIPLSYNNATMNSPEAGDYRPLETVRIPGGQTEGSGSVLTYEDADTDPETFIVALGSLPAGLFADDGASARVTILDVIPPLEAGITLSAAPEDVTEGDAVTLTVELSETLDNDVTIPLTLTAGTAGDADYEAPLPEQIGIPAGDLRGRYRITTVQDDRVEPEETFTVDVDVARLPPGIIGDSQPVQVTIVDNDAAGLEVVSSVRVPEGGGASFPVSLTSEPPGAVMLTLSGNSGTDLRVSPVALRYTPADWNAEQMITLRAEEDDDFEEDPVVPLILTTTGAGYTGVTSQVEVTIIENDRPGIYAPGSVTVQEGSSERLEVQLTQAPSGAVTLTLTGHAGTDVTPERTSLTFTPGSWNTAQAVTLSAARDNNLADETHRFMWTANGGGYTGETHPVQVTVKDIDEAALVVPSVITMAEGSRAPMEVSLRYAPSGTVTVTIRGDAGTDLAGSPRSLTFTPSNWQTAQTVTLSAGEDGDDRDDVEVLTLAAAGGGYDGVTHPVQVTILDQGPVTISILDKRELEDAGSLRLPMVLSRATDEVVTVQYTSADDTAEAGLDYTASRGVVIFDPGATRGVVEIKLIPDDRAEGEEAFTVSLSNPTSAVIIARGTGTGTILDRSPGAMLRVEDAQVQAEAGAVQFRVSLSHPQRRMVTAAYRTRDGTARAGEDYEATSGMVTLAPGTTEALIAVRLLKEDLDWEEETFTVHLESAKHAGLEKAVGVATIQESMAAGRKVLDAYAARFVRTASVQVVDALGGRFRRAADGAMCAAAERAEMAQLWYSASSWDPSLGELLAGCRMSQSMPLSSGSLSVWGQGAFRQFNGQGEDALTLRAEVTSGMLGADYRWSTGWLAGVLFAHSRGDGSFEMKEESGEIMSALTGIYPYVSYTRAGWEVWASAGAGRGNAEVLELKGDLTSRFGALGMQGTLVSGGTTRLRYHGDILVTDAEIKEHDITAEVYRIRAGLEASTQITGGIRPYVEANVRQDGGSAETGTGLELGGGVRFANPAWRLRGEVRTQGLVMHTADGFTEWGFSGSLQVGRATEGPMMRLRPSWGRGQGMSMYRQQTILDAAPMGMNAHRTELELGYGIPWKEGSARPLMGMTRLPQGRMYRLGGELRPWEQLSFSVFGLAHGHEAALGDIGVNVQGTIRY